MKKLLIMSLIITVLYFPDADGQTPGKLYAGLGAGPDYGGFGAQLSYQPVERAALFGGLGYNLNSAGYNLGARFSFLLKERINIHLTGMYGYNAVLLVEGDVTSKTTYYGPTVGGGLILKSKTPGRSFWSVEILLPFRPEAFHNAIEDLKMIGYDVKEPLPVAFSFGFHIKIR